MKVLFISRATLFTVKGGDTVQMQNTALQLRLLGIEVDIMGCNNTAINYQAYDLIHFFNITRPADIIYHIDKSKLPFVTSPIYMEYIDVHRYRYRHHPFQWQKDKRKRKNGEQQAQISQLWQDCTQTLQNNFLSNVGKNTLEYLKCIARWIKNGERITTPKYLRLGHRNSVEYILKRTACLLPNSNSELQRLKKDFKSAVAFAIIPNGVDTGLFHLDNNIEAQPNTVLCVARFEPIKNQLNIIKALRGSSYNLTLVGDIAPNHHDYYKQCLASAGIHANASTGASGNLSPSGKIRFLPYKDHKTLARLYHRHKVHILASWFETTGLSSLEAAACGCNIVITAKGDTVEYFKNNGYYCAPDDLDSIKRAVDRAMRAPVNNQFSQDIAAQYSWQQAAIRTRQAYLSIL